MKKNYINPVFKVFNIETESIMAFSTESFTPGDTPSTGVSGTDDGTGDPDAAGFRNTLWN